jgi:hypothetical protein
MRSGSVGGLQFGIRKTSESVERKERKEAQEG